MPVSIALLSPAGPRKVGQSSPALRVPKSGTSCELEAVALDREELESDERDSDEFESDEVDFEELGASFAAAKQPKQQKMSREAERKILGMSCEPRRQGGTLTDIL